MFIDNVDDFVDDKVNADSIIWIDPMFNVRCFVYFMIGSHFGNQEASREDMDWLIKINDLETEIDRLL